MQPSWFDRTIYWCQIMPRAHDTTIKINKCWFMLLYLIFIKMLITAESTCMQCICYGGEQVIRFSELYKYDDNTAVLPRRYHTVCKLQSICIDYEGTRYKVH